MKTNNELENTISEEYSSMSISSEDESDQSSSESEESNLSEESDGLTEFINLFKNSEEGESSEEAEELADSELSSENNFSEYEQQQEEDSDKDEMGEEPEDFTADYILQWIYETQEMDEDNQVINYIDYPALDCQLIVDRSSESTLRDVVETLLDDCIRKKDFEYFEVIQEIVTLANLDMEGDTQLNDALKTALYEQNEEVVKFLIAKGADATQGIVEAIEADSALMLSILDAEAEEDSVILAAEKHAYDAVDFLLQKDFISNYKTVLTVAIEDTDVELVEKVCENAELENIYDIVKYLVKKGGEPFLAIFFKHFPTKHLLQELREQDGGQGYYALMVDHAKNYLSHAEVSELELNELEKMFKETLTLRSEALIYPQEKFNGDEKLNAIRNAFEKNARLPEENRRASSLIGVCLSPSNSFLTPHPYHTQWDKAGAYFRSSHHPLSILVGPENARYEPHETLPEAKADKGDGNEAHLGIYKHPLQNLNDHRFFKRKKMDEKTEVGRMGIKEKKWGGTSNLYNRLLNFKKKTCVYIVKQCALASKSAIKVGYYQEYPCVMVYVEKQKSMGKISEGALGGWVEILISYFVGIVNAMAQNKNLNIELLRRSSFGFLVPTISPCKQSFRINVGIVPKEYADILVESLKQINAMLTTLEQEVFIKKTKIPNLALPETAFLKTPEYKNYLKDKKKPMEVPDVANIVKLVWTPVDKGRRAGGYNLMRTAAARDGMAAEVYSLFVKLLSKNSINYSSMDLVKILLSSLQWGFSKMRINKGKLQFEAPEEISCKAILQDNKKTIDDNNFFEIISAIVRQVKFRSSRNKLIADPIVADFNGIVMTLEEAINKKNIDHLYYYLAMLTELLYCETIYNEVDTPEDYFGSDSEVEGEIETMPNSNFYGKKLIVQNGMRAILAALHAGAQHLFPDYLKKNKEHNLFLYGTYYETADATKLLAKFNVIKTLSQISKAQILIYDINACVADGKKIMSLQAEHLKSIKVLIIDATSATTQEQHQWLKIFIQQTQIELLFLVASGLKLQQLGVDRNPHGTVRIFARNRELLDDRINFIRQLENPIRSNVAHHFRRLMKSLGATPRNATIAFPQDELKENPSEKTNYSP